VFEGTIVNDRGEIPGGQLMTTTEVENYPGFPEAVSGPDLMDHLRKQAERFGTRIRAEDVVRADLRNFPFRLTDSSEGGRGPGSDRGHRGPGQEARAQGERALLAERRERVRGLRRSPAPVPEQALGGDRGGDTAMEEAVFLTKYGSKVTIVHRRDEFRASRIMQERVLANPKIEVLWSHEVLELHATTGWSR